MALVTAGGADALDQTVQPICSFPPPDAEDQKILALQVRLAHALGDAEERKRLEEEQRKIELDEERRQPAMPGGGPRRMSAYSQQVSNLQAKLDKWLAVGQPTLSEAQATKQVATLPAPIHGLAHSSEEETPQDRGQTLAHMEGPESNEAARHDDQLPAATEHGPAPDQAALRKLHAKLQSVLKEHVVDSMLDLAVDYVSPEVESMREALVQRRAEEEAEERAHEQMAAERSAAAAAVTVAAAKARPKAKPKAGARR